MKDHELPSVAQKAIEHVLRYHDSCHTGLTDQYKAIIKGRIEALLPLKELAADPDVANLEIVSDAAMSFLDIYNQEHPENPLNQKWLYIGVQTLASIDLKPALVRGEVRRFSESSFGIAIRTKEPGTDPHDTPQADETEAQAGPDPDDLPCPPTAPASTSDDRSRDEPASTSDNEPPLVKAPRSRKRRSSGPHVANGKDPWGDEEIKKLIKWKAQGITHKEAGARLGRTEPACAIRHSIVLKQDRWIEFARAYRAKMAAGETSDEEEAESESKQNESEKMKETEEQEDLELNKETEKDDEKADDEKADDEKADIEMGEEAAREK